MVPVTSRVPTLAMPSSEKRCTAAVVMAGQPGAGERRALASSMASGGSPPTQILAAIR